MSDLTSRFPDLLPMEEIRVEEEEHTFEVIEYDDGTTSTKYEYTPDKAPVLDIEDVYGTVGSNNDFSFTEGVDYQVLDKDNDGRPETIDFSVGGEQPDDNTSFYVTYMCRSIIVRYIESYEDEFHRVQDDIEEAIESHYVDTASESGYIDNFEDEELVEYEFQAGDQQNATVQSATVSTDGWALEMNSPSAGSSVRLVSEAGLPRYPLRGDTLVYYTRLDNTDDISRFDFMYTESEGGTERAYRVEVNSDTDELKLTKMPNGARTDTTSVSISSHHNEWLQVEVDIQPIGDIDVQLRDDEETLLASVSIVDTEYTGGGIRWEAVNPNGTSEVYFDALDIVQRNSTDLDRVGAIFGELGKRRGRTDDEYATFLRSIVQSFSGRGTLDGIKFAVASALGLEADQITIDEDFDENEYTVSIDVPFPPHELRTLTELADLADPSGVEFASITYGIGEDEMGVSDTVSVTSGLSLSEEFGVDDSAVVNANTITQTDELGVNATVTIDANTVTAFDTLGVDGDQVTTASTDVNQFRWEQDNWDFMEWTEIIDLGTTSVSDEAGVDDAVTVDANKISAGIDEMSVDESATVTETIVAWELGDWETMDWAVEHN